MKRNKYYWEWWEDHYAGDGKSERPGGNEIAYAKYRKVKCRLRDRDVSFKRIYEICRESKPEKK